MTVFLGLGEVTKIEPLRQCLSNCRDAYTQNRDEGKHDKTRRYSSTLASEADNVAA